MRSLLSRHRFPLESLSNLSSLRHFHKRSKDSLALIFDKDGTLQDFYRSWIPWLEKNVQSLRYSPQDARSLFHLVGFHPSNRTRPLTDSSMLAHAGMIEIRRVIESRVGVEAMSAWSDVNLASEETVHPVVDDIRNVLLSLKCHENVRIALSTSDLEGNARSVLDMLEISDIFDMVVGCDTRNVPAKPDPNNILKICASLSVPPHQAIMIGDTGADMKMAVEAGARGVGVLSGVGTEDDLRNAGASVVLNHIGELGSLLRNPELLNLELGSSNSMVSRSHVSSFIPVTSTRSSVKYSTKANGVGGLLHTSSLHTSSTSDKRRIVIVGAGSAGCVLANRLSANDKNNVTLIEAGPSDRRLHDWWRLSMPSAMGMNLQNKTFNWAFRTTPQKHLNGREIAYPRGRVLGGSSSINAMVYLRGNRSDYDEWERHGAEGWGYEGVLPYFMRMETYHRPLSHSQPFLSLPSPSPPSLSPTLSPPSSSSPLSHSLSPSPFPLRGSSGPVHVSYPPLTNPLFGAFIEAGVQAGYPANPDFNGVTQDGFGAFDCNIRNGVRMSASKSYLEPILDRKNLTILTSADISRVVTEGRRAIGIEYLKNGRIQKLDADDVILSAGSIGSPCILQRSGIGDPRLMRLFGIDLVHALPGVGANLQDHLEVYVQCLCKEPVTLYPYQWSRPHNMIQVGAEWFLKGTGICSSNHLEAGAFVKSDASEQWPNIQFHFLPAAIGDQGSSMLDFGHAFQVHVGPLRSKSTGYVAIRSRDPTVDPIIDPNFLSLERDLEEFRSAVRISRQIFSQPAFHPFNNGERVPGVSVETDEEIDAFIREKGESAYHPCGTCKMGSQDDPMSVVDSFGRVIGVSGLWVADASIMPKIVSANLNCPSIMIGEKISDSFVN